MSNGNFGENTKKNGGRKDMESMDGKTTRRKFLARSILAAGAFGASVAAFPRKSSASNEEIEIKMYEFLPETTPWHEIVFQHWRDTISRLTEGRVKPVLYPAGSICDLKTTHDAVTKGIADWGLVLPGFTPGRFPLIDIVELPGLFPNMAIGNLVMQELFELFPQFKAEYKNVKFLSMGVMMPTDLHSVKPIRRIDEIRGKKIGCQGGAPARALKALGDSVMVMQFSEMYQAAERGIIDGAVIAWGSMSSWSLHEVFHYHSLLRICPCSLIEVMNLDKWKKISRHDQDVIETLCFYYSPRQFNKGNKVQRAALIRKEITEEKGHEIISFPPEDLEKASKLYEPLCNAWADDMEAKGLPGRKILKTAFQFVTDYRNA